MPVDWEHLQQSTAAAQLTFLDSEADTGITLAGIAVGASDSDKKSRNILNARKAYDAIISRLQDLPASTPGLKAVRKKMETLQDMLRSLGEQI